MVPFGQTVTPLALLKEVTLQISSCRMTTRPEIHGKSFQRNLRIWLLLSLCGSDNPLSISHTILSAVMTPCWFASTRVFVIFSSFPPHNILGCISPHSSNHDTSLHTSTCFKVTAEICECTHTHWKMTLSHRENSFKGKTHLVSTKCHYVYLYTFKKVKIKQLRNIMTCL